MEGDGSAGATKSCFLPGNFLLLYEIYRETDYNHLGTIDAREMRTALKKAGEDTSCRQGLESQMCSLSFILIFKNFYLFLTF